VLQLGKQPCGKVWVISEDCFLNENGQYDNSECYVWLKNITSFGGLGKQSNLQLEDIMCDVTQDLSADSFPPLIKNLKACLQHNFLSAVLLMGGGVMAFHYRKIIEVLRFCPQVIAVGPPSTGKSISLQAALSLFGANNCKNLYNCCSKAYLLQRCAISTIPFGIDDPNIAVDIGDVIISLYIGMISANIAHGSLQPLSCPLYCANFDFGCNERQVYVHINV